MIRINCLTRGLRPARVITVPGLPKVHGHGLEYGSSELALAKRP